MSEENLHSRSSPAPYLRPVLLAEAYTRLADRSTSRNSAVSAYHLAIEAGLLILQVHSAFYVDPQDLNSGPCDFMSRALFIESCLQPSHVDS